MKRQKQILSSHANMRVEYSSEVSLGLWKQSSYVHADVKAYKSEVSLKG